MSFARYPEYKDSGVEWLGEVPGHWTVTALKRGFSVTLGKMLQPESSSPDDELLPYLRAANIQWGGVDTTDIKQMWLSKRDRAQLRLEKGDLLVSEGGDVGRSCLWAAELDICYFQNSVNRVRARDGHSNRYLYYWMSTIKDKGYIDVLCNKSTIAHFTAEKVAAVPVPLPTPTEQTQIAAFLDRETAKIDALVAEQRRLMALLKEKRQAVISHAVTRGLNPQAPMKPSGIEWLGDVPAHWDVKPMRMIANVVRGASPRPAGDPRYFGGDAVPWVTVGEITKDDAVYLTETENFLTEDGATHSNLFRFGTLIYSNSGATLGVPKVLSIDACANDGVVAFLNLSDQVQAEFLYHYLASITDAIREKVKQGSGQPNLNTDIVKELRFGLPPLGEQEMIVTRISELAEQFGALTTEAQRAIDLLQERRTALISAAVTGQIDVRGAVRSL